MKLISGLTTLSLLASTMANRPPLSIFYITSTTDDTSLYYAILVLQYLMTDLSKYFLEDVFSEDTELCKRGQKARNDAQSVIFGLTDIDSKLREYSRVSYERQTADLAFGSLRYGCALGQSDAQ